MLRLLSVELVDELDDYCRFYRNFPLNIRQIKNTSESLESILNEWCLSQSSKTVTSVTNIQAKLPCVLQQWKMFLFDCEVGAIKWRCCSLKTCLCLWKLGSVLLYPIISWQTNSGCHLFSSFCQNQYSKQCF